MASRIVKCGERCEKVSDTLSLWGNRVGMFLLAFMLAGNAVEVTARYVFNRSTGVMDELLVYSNIGIIFLALGWAWKMKGHINVDLFIGMLRGRLHTAIYLGGLILSFLTLMTMLVATCLYESSVIKSGLKAYTVLGTPRWLPMIMVLIGLLLFCLQMARTVVKDIKLHLSKTESGE